MLKSPSIFQCFGTVHESMHVFAALSEFERNLIRERTHAGLTAARGRKGGNVRCQAAS